MCGWRGSNGGRPHVHGGYSSDVIGAVSGCLLGVLANFVRITATCFSVNDL